MNVIPSSLTDPPSKYRHLSTRFESQYGAFWLILDPKPLPCVSLELIDELRRFQEEMARTFEGYAPGEHPIRFFIAASNSPGVFNLGGDLSLFARCVEEKDVDTLRKYALGCIETLYPYIIGFNLPITTISLVQGDALGGGFEIALAGNIIIAERSAKLGFPEVLFNLFPGMGAYNLLSRRIGVQRTEQMLLNGKMYQAEELHAEGVVDILAEDGRGENAVYEYIVRNENRGNAREGIQRVRRRLFPLPYQDLLDVAEIWVDTAMRIGPREIRLMERLVRSQGKLSRREPIPLFPLRGKSA
ncbi:MAG: crotonase/enoyl-CoA hydratase family protein [Deltaproteobacteria bacterium]|nr:crotonase/enoyl-CoA hydratase family protein [Deltaproteobacteria bacterium]